jgi:epoxyqueuosine reductase
MDKYKIRDYCKSIGIDYVGVIKAKPFDELREILKERIKNGYYTGFEEENIEKRVDPRITLDNAKSIIVCGFPYYVLDIENSNISKYTYGKDYHIVVKEKLESICKFVESKVDGFEYIYYTDTGPLVDRYLANLAGIGYFGVNNNIINDEYGSYIFIGYIISNHDFYEYDKPLDKTCIKCGKCIKMCPGNAILGNFEINPKRCISFLTQKKEDLLEEEINILNNNKKVFGCDICQEVCPHNKDKKVTNIEEFKESLIYNLDYNELEDMSNKEFKRKYGDRSFSWRGKKIIIRNMNLTKKSCD